MYESGVYTVWTQRNVSGHNPTIYSQPKYVNWVFTKFRLRGMCLDTIPEFLANQKFQIRYLISVDLGEYVQTHSLQSELYKYRFYTCWINRNCGIVSRHIPPSWNSVNIQLWLPRNSGIVSGHIPLSQNHVNTQFTYFEWLEIFGLCLDTFPPVQTVQILNLHILDE